MSDDRDATGQQKQGGLVVKITCAFCGGTGRDPFGIMSPLSICGVCRGNGSRTLVEPVARCAFCQGTGVHPGSRMSCTTCSGIGTVSIPEHYKTCPCCGGSGRASDYVYPDSPLSCGCCHGKGIVFASSESNPLEEG